MSEAEYTKVRVEEDHESEVSEVHTFDEPRTPQIETPPRIKIHDALATKDLQPMQLEESKPSWSQFLSQISEYISRRPWIIFAIGFPIAMLLIVGAILSVLLTKKTHVDMCKPTSIWNGWDSMKHHFVL
jgi:hypothetical protein